MYFSIRTISGQLQTQKAAHYGTAYRCFYRFTYLQFAQVQFEPQLQLTQVQFGLLHFTFGVL